MKGGGEVLALCEIGALGDLVGAGKYVTSTEAA